MLKQVKVRLNLKVVALWPPELDMFSKSKLPALGHMLPQAKEWFLKNACDIDHISSITDSVSGETVGFMARRKVA